MSGRPVEHERFKRSVEAVRAEFPALRVEVVAEHPELDALAEIPAQPGLEFQVDINLQNRDELHLNASKLWVAWFPCGDPEVFDAFLEALRGLLSGSFRIRESWIGGMAVKAELQRPAEDGSWATVTGWSNLGTLIPWKRSIKYLQNRPGASSRGGRRGLEEEVPPADRNPENDLSDHR